MRIKTIVFGDYQDESYPKLESVITKSFMAITGKDEAYFAVYDSIRPGLADIADALKTSDTIVIFADEKMYHDAKKSVCGAFKFPMIHSEQVLEKFEKVQNNERYMVHALIPKNSTPFVLSDGICPGFAVRSKKQCILFLPFSEDRTFITMKKYVFPYLSRVYGMKLPSFNSFETEYSARILEEKIDGTDIKIAIANTDVCKYIAHAGKKIECFNDHISYAPFDKNKASSSPDEYAAVSSAEYYECRFGASIIEQGQDSGSYTAKICISNGLTSVIRTISSIADESHSDFMCTVIEEFFLMLAEEITIAPEMTKKELKAIKPTSVIHGVRILIYALLFATTFFFTYVTASFAASPIFG